MARVRGADGRRERGRVERTLAAIFAADTVGQSRLMGEGEEDNHISAERFDREIADITPARG